jgi:cytochrome P450
VVLLFPRLVTQDIELNGKTVPKGTMLFWSPFLNHQNKGRFDNPDVFDPERWGRKDAPTTSLVGFGGGPRICLGKAFALVQLRVMATTLLRRFSIAHANGPEVKVLALPTHRPRDVKLRFTPHGAA